MTARGGLEFVKPVPREVQVLEKQLQSADPVIRKQWLGSIGKSGAPAEPFADLCGERLMKHENFYVRRTGASALCQGALEINGASKFATKWAGQLMNDEDAEVRRCASQCIVELHIEAEKAAEIARSDPEHTVFGTDAVQAMRKARKQAAAKAELAAGVADEAAEQAAAHLNDESPSARLNAVQALSKMEARAAPHMHLLTALLADPDLQVRNETVRAFSRLGMHARNGAMGAAAHFEHQNHAVRRCAHKALMALSVPCGRIAAAGAASQLRSQILHARFAAATCLAEMRELAVPHSELLIELLEDDDLHMRLVAGRALVSAGDGVAPYLNEILKRLGHENERIRNAAEQALRGLAPKILAIPRSQAKVLVEESGGSYDIIVRGKRAALSILGGGEANSADYLEDCAKELEHEDWGVRRTAIEAFESLGNHAAGLGAKFVAKRLLHNNADVRRAAAETLGRMGQHAGVYAGDVETQRETEEDDDVRRVCDEAVRRLVLAGVLQPSEETQQEPQSPVSPGGRRLRRGSTRGSLSPGMGKRRGSRAGL